jgi:hypothetical protein
MEDAKNIHPFIVDVSILLVNAVNTLPTFRQHSSGKASGSTCCGVCRCRYKENSMKKWGGMVLFMVSVMTLTESLVVW